MSEFVTKLQHFVKTQFPAYIRDEYPVFVDFLEAYYKFLDQPDQAGGLLQSAGTWTDIDRTLDQFVEQYRKQYAPDIPISAVMDSRRLVKYINEYYEGKGSENGVKMFFRLMYNETVSVDYPGDHILRASDGKWSRKKIIKVDTSVFSEENIYEVKNKTIQLNYVEFIPNQGRIIRSVSTSCFNVTRQIEPEIYQLEVDINPDYQFPSIISPVEGIDINGDGVVENIPSMGDYDTHVYVVCDGTIYGSLSNQIVEVYAVNDPGSNFRVDDAYVIGQYGIEGFYFVGEGPEGYFYESGEDPYFFDEFDNNAIIRISRTTTAPERGVSQIQLISTGQKFLARELSNTGNISYFEFPIDVEDSYIWDPDNEAAGPDAYASDTQELIPTDILSVNIIPKAPRNLTGEEADIQFRTGIIYEQPGSFRDSAGFLSDINHLQDNYFYQPYSYVITSEQQKSAWEKAYLKSNHPAGFKMFSILQFNDSFSVPIQFVDLLTVFGGMVVVELFEGERLILSRTLSPDSSWDTFEFTLTPFELSRIEDPNNLTVRFRKTNSDGVDISQVSMTIDGTLI